MGSNVVLEQNRDAMERTANLPGPALLVASLGNLKRVAICFDNGMQQRIELGDAFQVIFHQLAAGKCPRSHEPPEFGNCSLDPRAIVSEDRARRVGEKPSEPAG